MERFIHYSQLANRLKCTNCDRRTNTAQTLNDLTVNIPSPVGENHSQSALLYVNRLNDIHSTAGTHCCGSLTERLPGLCRTLLMPTSSLRMWTISARVVAARWPLLSQIFSDYHGTASLTHPVLDESLTSCTLLVLTADTWNCYIC